VSSDPQYLRKLKQYARDQFGQLGDTERVLADLHNESDRGAIILVATSLEDALEAALMERMAALQTDSEAKTKIFGADGTLSTYSDKILLAYALGIIDKKTRKDIDAIRHIRNACAHCRKPLSLKEPILITAIRATIDPELLADAKDSDLITMRAAFIVHCTTLSWYVLTGQRKRPLEFFSAGGEAERELAALRKRRKP
jgi:DNA-binding MltR family transcriptional regulator